MKQKFTHIEVAKGIAILMILLVHYNQSFTKANICAFRFMQMGCQLFFVISGYTIANSLFQKVGSSKFDRSVYFQYLRRRYVSLAPAWYTMLILYSLLALVKNYLRWGHPVKISVAGILCNAFFLQGLLPFCNNNVMPGGWYVGTAVILYGIAPFVYRILLKHKIYQCLICILLSAFSLFSLYILSKIYENTPIWFPNNSFGYFLFLTQFPCFCSGMLLFCAHLPSTKVYNAQSPIFDAPSIALPLVFFCVFYLLAYIMFFSSLQYRFIIDVLLCGIAYYYLLLLLMQCNAMQCNAMQSQPSQFFVKKIGMAVKKLGSLSYYIFLVHWLFVSTLMKAFHSLANHYGICTDNYLVYVIMFFVCLYCSYKSAVILANFSSFI